MIKYILLFCLFSFISLSAQETSHFDKICIKTIVETSAQSMPKAFKIADSLYNSSDTPLGKAKSLLLIASLHRQVGNFKKSLLYAEKAKYNIEQTDNADWNLRITGYLATQYRIVGLYDKAAEYVDQADVLSKKITVQSNLFQAEALLNQERAYHEIYKKRYQKAIRYAEISLASLKKINSKDVSYTNYITANSYELLGDSYYYLDNYPTSEIYYNKANTLLDSPSPLQGFVFNGLGMLSLKKKDWKQAKESLEKAKKIAETLNNRELRQQVYFNLSEYYDNTGKPELASQYYKKYIEISNLITKEIQELVNESYSKLNSSNEMYSQRSLLKSFIILLLFVLSIGLVIFFNLREQKQRKRFSEIIEMTKKNSEMNAKSVLLSDQESKEKKKDDSPMTSEKEVHLLKSLEKFEKSNLFNDKNMSLSHLASKLNTNTRYLSYIINTHKGEEFKTYINRLRINYIIIKLTNEDIYRQYKISVLADECGFSSHSKFTAVFKNFTGLSPSLFIKYLDEKPEAIDKESFEKIEH
ncbi:AraC family transcriptional regulator [Chryseobacterium sp. G0240]|nr:AraC family transcriptional regulator [Chryseobacterium sp. G0240]